MVDRLELKDKLDSEYLRRQAETQNASELFAFEDDETGGDAYIDDCESFIAQHAERLHEVNQAIDQIKAMDNPCLFAIDTALKLVDLKVDLEYLVERVDRNEDAPPRFAWSAMTIWNLHAAVDTTAFSGELTKALRRGHPCTKSTSSLRYLRGP